MTTFIFTFKLAGIETHVTVIAESLESAVQKVAKSDIASKATLTAISELD